jgi:ABC-type phosphate/phosphonate transport system substrate-binding protein
LSRTADYDSQWQRPDFFFGQACGYDVQIANARRLAVVATPCYVAPGCIGSTYRSFVVVRDDSPLECLADLRGTRCVINTPTSHSGMNILRSLVAPMHADGRFFQSVKISGSHERSLRMILRREVDVAAIDCVTHALLVRHRPSEIEGTRVLMSTQEVPAPPFVTGLAAGRKWLPRMRRALHRALDQAALAEAKAALLLDRIEVLPDEAYSPIAAIAAVADEHDYREIPDLVESA